MRDVFRVLIMPILLLAAHSENAAAQQKVSCTTVEASAIVEADAGITVGYLGNPKTRTCTFYVRKAPPLGTPSTAQEKATKLTLDFWANPDEKQILYELVPALQAALLEPIQAGPYEPQFVKSTAEAFEAQNSSLAKCAVGAFFNKAEFQSYSDVVSCGVVEKGRYFGVEAKTADIVSAIFLPLAE